MTNKKKITSKTKRWNDWDLVDVGNKRFKDGKRESLADEIWFLEKILKHSSCMCDEIQSSCERRLKILKEKIK